MSEINLPATIVKTTAPALAALTSALGIPREVLASDDEIQNAWANLPSVLKKIPVKLRDENVAKMCVAVAAGLFDSAINYIWNASTMQLREKVRCFGITAVQQLLSRPTFDEKALSDMQDAGLLELCLQLNLITEDGYFFLNQCRDIRNTFSAAHPPMGALDEHEFISFVNRCAKYALGDERNLVGVDTQAFITAIKKAKFSESQENEWVQRLTNTHQAQREFLIGTMHGMYCDPATPEDARINCLSIAKRFIETISAKAKSDLIVRHQDYIAKDQQDRHRASQQFFEKLGCIKLLSDSERHALIAAACAKLLEVHNAFNNFYNEPPFAERIYELTTQGAIPETAQEELVVSVMTAAVGNQYGVSSAAHLFYEKIIKGFSPVELTIMLKLPRSKTLVGDRIQSHKRCQYQFKELVKLIDPASVHTSVKVAYDGWLS